MDDLKELIREVRCLNEVRGSWQVSSMSILFGDALAE
jgi:hypothetical protein